MANLLRCPQCGNESDFFEVTDDVVTTTYYTQNSDGSFSISHRNSESLGGVRLFCGNCEEDLTSFHPRFVEMIF